MKIHINLETDVKSRDPHEEQGGKNKYHIIPIAHSGKYKKKY